MSDEKPWYLSRTIWAALVALLFPVATFFGWTTELVDQQSLADTLMQLAAAIAGVVAIFGRMKATSRIS